MGRKLWIFVLLITVTLITSCADSTVQGESTPCQEKAEDIVQETTYLKSENWDWVSLVSNSKSCYEDIVGENSELISSAIAVWEKDHPEREIVDIDIVVQPRAYLTCSDIIGISIYSMER